MEFYAGGHESSEAIDPNVPVTVEPAAAKLRMTITVRTVADILALAEWPAE